MPRTKVALVIGAGDSTGGAIARRFAREGFFTCVTRRHGDQLAPLVQRIEQDGGAARAFGSDARREEDSDRPIRNHRARHRPDRGRFLQRRRQRPLSDPRNHHPRLHQSVGDVRPGRLPRRARGGKGHGPPPARHDPVHRRHGQRPRRLPATPPSPAASMPSEPWRKAWRANSAPRASMSPMSSSMAPSTPISPASAPRIPTRPAKPPARSSTRTRSRKTTGCCTANRADAWTHELDLRPWSENW